MFFFSENKDALLKKMDELERTSSLYKGLIDHTRILLKSMFEMATCHKAFGDLFASIGAREQQLNASNAFSKFGEAHRQMDKFAHTLLKTIKPVKTTTKNAYSLTSTHIFLQLFA